VASFSIPAWAVSATKIFQDYAPFSWVAAGFLGVGFTVLCYMGWQWAIRQRAPAKFNAALLEKGATVNPLAPTFEGQRIFINDFILPSLPLVKGKTFINCDIIGPANFLFTLTVQTNATRPPQIDAVWLHETNRPSLSNVIIFDDCIFRDCSFQRITLYVDIGQYRGEQMPSWFNFVSIFPTTEQAEQRRRQALQLAPRASPPAVVDEAARASQPKPEQSQG
jgi:hypothetical protein